MKALKEGNKIITITCKCGSTDFYRGEHEATICKTYLEGYFNCSNCFHHVELFLIIIWTNKNYLMFQQKIKVKITKKRPLSNYE